MRKLLWFTIGFAAAIALGAYVLTPNVYFYVSGIAALALAICLALMFRFPKVRLGAMICFGCVAGLVSMTIFEAACLSIARVCEGQTLHLTLIAADESYTTNYGAATECRGELNGKEFAFWVYHDSKITLAPGDAVDGDFLLRCTLPGCQADSDYNRANGIFLTARPKSQLKISTVENPPWYVHAARWRIALTNNIKEIFPADTAAFACALLLGDTDDIDYATDTAFKLSGIRHVIAVSGLHISILFSLVYAISGRRKWLTVLLGLPVLVIFAAIAGFTPSITRACIMNGLMLLAMVFDREYDPPTALSFAVFTMLAVNPWTITNVGFQLSVGCLIGIFLFAEPIKQWLLHRKHLGRFDGWKGKVAQWFAVSISISLSANVFTTALCAYYFGIISLVSPITNLLVLWIVTFIFYGIMLALVAGGIFAPLGTAAAWVVSWGIRYVLWVAKAMASLPFAAVYTESIYIVFWLIFCYILLAVLILWKRKHPFMLAGCAALALCMALMTSWLEPLSDNCRMTVLDVGQGQCILLQSEGKNFLIDCGGDSDTAAADKAAALLLSQGIGRLDGLILTHYDADHAGGAALLLTRLDTEMLFLPNSIDEEGTAQTLFNAASGDAVRIDRTVEITFGAAKITLIPSKNAESDNESGLCVLFQRENCDILITGDRSANGELELIEDMELPRLEVLIVGHHGSKYSTCRELLIKTQPQYAFVSAGLDNMYGHPSAEVLERLEHYGCIVLRTDLYGNIIYRG